MTELIPFVAISILIAGISVYVVVMLLRRTSAESHIILKDMGRQIHQNTGKIDEIANQIHQFTLGARVKK
jgi:hypothetical protein